MLMQSSSVAFLNLPDRYSVGICRWNSGRSDIRIGLLEKRKEQPITDVLLHPKQFNSRMGEQISDGSGDAGKHEQNNCLREW
ncbi:hypothetical protein XELAEV_18025143mg [Xenopus laevis]|uniref:Uncharacterized protein n=1 Tax=Xenopus laevis TaxID=8355 RepID=A0A974CYX9_XENLA|nr:hypothetical protein XELAEV_18025143mg [Xenopus laevis]